MTRKGKVFTHILMHCTIVACFNLVSMSINVVNEAYRWMP